jgi:hypothetical protein
MQFEMTSGGVGGGVGGGAGSDRNVGGPAAGSQGATKSPNSSSFERLLSVVGGRVLVSGSGFVLPAICNRTAAASSLVIAAAVLASSCPAGWLLGWLDIASRNCRLLRVQC